MVALLIYLLQNGKGCNFNTDKMKSYYENHVTHKEIVFTVIFFFICYHNKEKKFNYLEKTESYLKSLKLPNETSLFHCTRFGVLACINSSKSLYIQIIELERRFKYLPSYKINEDHLELLFGHIRAHGGCSTNPMPRHFRAIKKNSWLKIN